MQRINQSFSYETGSVDMQEGKLIEQIASIKEKFNASVMVEREKALVA